MAITLEGLKITISAEPGGIGSSESNPYRMSDLAASVPNIIEIIVGGGSARTFYYCPYALHLSPLTHFKFYMEMVLFGEDVNHLGSRLNSGSASYFYLTNTQMMENGTEFSTLYNFIATDCAFFHFRGFSFYTGVRLTRCKFVSVGSTYWSNSTNIEIYDCSMSGTPYGNIPRNNIVDIRNKLMNCTYGLLLGYNTGGDVKLYNTEIIGCTNDLAYQPLTHLNYTTTLVDPLVDLNKQLLMVTTSGKKVTLDVATLMSFVLNDADGASIVIYDKDGNIHYQGLYSEGLQEEVVYYRRYVKSQGIYGVPEEDVENTYHPFVIEVIKSEYQPLIIPNIFVVSGKATNIIGRMVLVALSIDSVSITDATEIGGTDGSLEITASGGDGSYEYSINGTDYQASNTFTGLAAGTYTVYVRDGEGTAETLEDVEVTEPELRYIHIHSQSPTNVEIKEETKEVELKSDPIVQVNNSEINIIQIPSNETQVKLDDNEIDIQID